MTAKASVLALALAGCAAVAGRDGGAVPVSHHLPTAKQISAVRAAEARAGYAGSWYEGGVLHLAFDATGIQNATALSADGVRVVQVRFSGKELEAARQRVVQLLERKGGPGKYAVTIDKPRNGVSVEAVETIGSPGARCLGANDLPPSDPVNGVPILNKALCG